jgi:hypothetical protein
MSEESNTKNVLFLPHSFPPQASAAIFRALRFCRDLPQFGWNCHVVTPNEKCTNQRSDVSLIPDTTHVHRFACHNLAEHADFVVQDPKTPRWKYLAARAMCKLLLKIHPLDLHPTDVGAWSLGTLTRAVKRTMKRTSIDAIVIPLPPFSWAVTLERIRKFSDVPIILDFRDAWSSNVKPGAPSYKFASEYEPRLLAQADGAIFNTHGAMEYYAQRYPDLDHRHWTTITNGFVRDQIDAIPAESFSKTTFVYGGLGRTGQMIMIAEALAGLRDRGILNGDNFEFIAYGDPAIQVQSAMDRFNVADLMTFRGTRSQQEVIASLKGASGLILLQLMEHAKHTPGKLYEYIATGRPTLMIGPTESCPADILRDTQTGWCVEPTVEAISEGFESLLAGTPMTPDSEAVNQYESTVLSGKLASLLDQIITDRQA